MGKANVYYHDIGDYLDKEQKLKIISDFKSIKETPFQEIKPNKYGDWVNQRRELPKPFIPIAPRKKFQDASVSFYTTHSCGLNTARGHWVYNFNKDQLTKNVNNSIVFFNKEVERYQKRTNKKISAKDFVDKNPEKFSWDRDIYKNIEKNKKFVFNKNSIITSHYRPFCKQKLYFYKHLNSRQYQNNRLFPTPKHQNQLIAIPGLSSQKRFSCLISNHIVDLGFNDTATQCFPLYYYDKIEKTAKETPIFYSDTTSASAGKTKEQYTKKDAISDFILQKARSQYNHQGIIKEDIFYYVYGFLHSPEYRETYAIDLKKSLPRIPLVDNKDDFWAFSTIGRQLADIHLHYEKIEPHHEVVVNEKGLIKFNAINADQENAFDFYAVTKMNFKKDNALKTSENKRGLDKTTIIYNQHITVCDIPLRAYDYVVNGKSAIEWIMDRYQVKTDKKSGITNNPNDWSRETNNPRYILDLLLSVIHLSVKTLDLIEQLPKVEFK